MTYSLHCQFCQRLVAADVTLCPSCGKPAFSAPSAPGSYVSSIPLFRRVRLAPAGLAGAVLIAVGSFLPWGAISVLFSTLRHVEPVMSLETGRIFMLSLALVLGLLSVLAAPTWRWLQVGCSVLALLVGLFKLAAMQEVAQNFRDAADLGGDVELSLGIGLYMVFAGALLALVTALRGTRAVGDDEGPKVEDLDAPAL